MRGEPKKGDNKDPRKRFYRKTSLKETDKGETHPKKKRKGIIGDRRSTSKERSFHNP